MASHDDLQDANFAFKGAVAMSFLVENGLQSVVVSGKAAQPRPTEEVVAEAQPPYVPAGVLDRDEAGLVR